MIVKRMRPVIAVLGVLTLAAMAFGCATADDRATRQQGMQRDNAFYGQQQTVGDRGAAERIEIADQAAERIVTVPGVRSANVLVTRNNAYVAAVLDDGRNVLSRETEERIANKVRQVDPRIRNVYVSTNPEFVDRVNNYVTDVRQGRPVEGFVEQFNEMVQRLFPTAR